MSGLGKLLQPRSIALIGASDDRKKIRGRTLAILKAAGFSGPIYPVNPGKSEIQGLKAYDDILQVPGPVDLAVIALGAEMVIGALEDCAKAGVGAAIVFASGFAEGGDEGAQDRIAQIARETGMRILGPNTVGYFDESLGIAPGFSPIMSERLEQRSEVVDLDSAIDIVCQSGGLGFALYSRALAAGIAVRTIVTTGNEADCDAIEIGDHLVSRGGSKAIIMFIEGFSKPANLAALARKARENGVALIVAKLGRSPAGQRAAISHTAHLTGSDAVTEAVFARHGILRALDPESLLAMAAAAARLPKARGKRIAIVTTSGGTGGWAADIFSDAGLVIPETGVALAGELEPLIPGYGSTSNPIDVTANVVEDGGIALAGVVRKVVESGEFDGVLVILSLVARGRLTNMREMLAPVLTNGTTPVIFHSPGIPTDDNVAVLKELGAVQLSLRDAAAAFVGLARLGENLPIEQANVSDSNIAMRVREALAPGAPRGSAGAILAGYCVPTPPEAVVANAADAVTCARDMGFPVALKVESPDIAHKTDAGCVVLGVGNVDAVSAAFEKILANAKASAPGARVAGVLVQKMAPAGIETVVGLTRDPDFGPMIMLGLGGIHVEVLRDTVLMPAPVSIEEARSMIDRLRAAAILKGARGATPGDLDALAKCINGLSRLAIDAGSALAEADLNPVIVYPEGQGVLAVDHLLVAGDAL